MPQIPLPAFAPPAVARSRNMAAIHDRDTGLEITVRKTVYAAGFRYRLRPKDVAGRPDLVFRKRGIAVFVNGCFWHGHNCKIGHIPKSNASYWAAKIQRNVDRDQRNESALKTGGWDVVKVWECRLRGDLQRLLTKLAEATPNS
jgi:DNA mismatch endonuclease Vsr